MALLIRPNIGDINFNSLYLLLILIINNFTYDCKQKHICNVAFINAICKVIVSKVFTSIVVVS